MKISILILLLLLFNGIYAQDFDHSKWDAFLNEHVDQTGNVDYASIKEDESKLKESLNQFINTPPLKSWEKEEKLAYWINAYNAFIIKLIVDNYPLKSIKDIKAPWDKKFIPIDGELISLNYIEHEILRKMNEPRIHFAINCASVSCPQLLNEAFAIKKLNSQLNEVTSRFINNPTKNVISGNQLHLSKIFQWFKKDFGQKDSSIIEFINQYSLVKAKQDSKINYLKYNWNLNGQ